MSFNPQQHISKIKGTMTDFWQRWTSAGVTMREISEYESMLLAAGWVKPSKPEEFDKDYQQYLKTSYDGFDDETMSYDQWLSTRSALALGIEDYDAFVKQHNLYNGEWKPKEEELAKRILQNNSWLEWKLRY